MQKISDNNENVTKYIHNDGSETSIKCTKSGKYILEDDKLNIKFEDHSKYNIVISCSVGCVVQCKFCHLKDKEYHPLSVKDIVNNVKEAIIYEHSKNKDIENKYVKLCFMGMGEPAFLPGIIKQVAEELIEWIISKKYAIGIDGIDIGTTIPVQNSLTTTFDELFDSIDGKYKVNPNKKDSLVRLFYSLHSVEKRNRLIPNSVDVVDAFNILKQSELNKVVHYIFFKGINDSDEQVENLIKFWNNNDLQDFEFRILRFNECNELQESDRIIEILKKLEGKFKKFKVQYSSGKEIHSACGMFL